jgi:hypothetical protein
MSPILNAQLVIAALRMALGQRRPLEPSSSTLIVEPSLPARLTGTSWPNMA